MSKALLDNLNRRIIACVTAKECDDIAKDIDNLYKRKKLKLPEVLSLSVNLFFRKTEVNNEYKSL